MKHEHSDLLFFSLVIKLKQNKNSRLHKSCIYLFDDNRRVMQRRRKSQNSLRICASERPIRMHIEALDRNGRKEDNRMSPKKKEIFN